MKTYLVTAEVRYGDGDWITTRYYEGPSLPLALAALAMAATGDEEQDLLVTRETAKVTLEVTA